VDTTKAGVRSPDLLVNPATDYVRSLVRHGSERAPSNHGIAIVIHSEAGGAQSFLHIQAPQRVIHVMAPRCTATFPLTFNPTLAEDQLVPTGTAALSFDTAFRRWVHMQSLS
jgi:hypothetical protein